MAETCAPLADFDSEEWNEFHDFGEPQRQDEEDSDRRMASDENDDIPPLHSSLPKRVRVRDEWEGPNSRRTIGESPNDDTCPPDTFNDTFNDTFVDAFGESASTNDLLSGSLEDLVNTFDDKVTKCFHDYKEHVEKIAPVQVRTEAEVGMRESQYVDIQCILYSAVAGGKSPPLEIK